MKDIDFDELDKAVNSLMGGVKSTSEDSSQKTLAISTTLKEGEEPVYDKLRRVAEKIGSETIQQPSETTEIIPDTAPQAAPLELTSAPTVATPKPSVTPAEKPTSTVAPAPVAAPEPKQKASGRFMDVMHPSSDMTTPGSGSSETKPVPAPAPAAPAIAVPTREPKKTPIVPISAPDPEPVPVVAPVEVEVPAGPATVETPPEPSAPLTSPFLPDPKVEKRPLGGQPAPEEKELTSGLDVSTLEAPLKSDTSTDAQVTPDATNPDLPLELHSDLLEIEKNAAELIPDEPEAEPESAQPELVKLDVVAPAPKETTQKSAVAESAPAPATLDTSASDEDHPSDGAIFDTSQYHTPVAHPAKHGREWLWIVVIIVIVIISAAGGAAFYLLGA